MNKNPKYQIEIVADIHLTYNLYVYINIILNLVE